MRPLERGFQAPNLFWTHVHHSENENDTQFERMRSFPMHSHSTPLNARVGFENSELATKSSPCVSSPTKLVYLYKWYLIRAAGNDPDNDINRNGVQVAIGGYTTSELLDTEKFTTAPIESRIEKCKLRTVDGLNILLIGAIDDQCTYNNGFPFQVVHLFLTGFPFNWNRVINLYFGLPRLSRSVLSTRKPEENVGQLKDEVLNSEHVGKRIKGVGTGKLSFQEPRENVSKVTSLRESSAECSKSRKSGMQPSVLSAGKWEDNTGQLTDEVRNSEHVGKQVESVKAGKSSFQEAGENMSKAKENMLNVTSPKESPAECCKKGKCKIQPIRSSKRSKDNRLNMESEPETPSPLVDLNEDSNVSSESAIYISSDKRPIPRKLLPIPTPRVKATAEEVSKAFGLKTSRSGRLIIPPLAHWCNQTVAYDLDGGIIAIFDGSSLQEEKESAFNFKPPQQKGAAKLRKKLCNAANEIIRTPSSVKKTHKD